MKKIFTIASLTSIALTSSLFANAGPAAPAPAVVAPVPVAAAEGKCSDCFKSGFYFGGQAGYNSFRTKFDTSRNDQFDPDTNYSDTDSKNDGKFLGELVLGGRYIYNCMVLGAEFDMAVNDTANVSREILGTEPGGDPDIYEISVKRTSFFKPNIVLGYAVHPRVLVYTKLGLAFSSFKIQESEEEDPDGRTLIGKGTRAAFAPSLGVEYCMSEMISCRLEVGAEFYKKIRRTFICEDPGVNNAGITLIDNQKSRSVSSTVGLVVKI